MHLWGFFFLSADVSYFFFPLFYFFLAVWRLNFFIISNTILFLVLSLRLHTEETHNEDNPQGKISILYWKKVGVF